MNPATEATLAELLEIAKTMGKDTEKMRKIFEEFKKTGGIGGGGGSVGGAMGGIATAAESVVKVFNPLSMVAGLLKGAFDILSNVVAGVSNVLGLLIGDIAKTAVNLAEFSAKAVAGKAKVSDFVDAFRDLPFMLGTLASIVADLVRYLEGLLEQYKTMTNVGASFTGSISEMRISAARAQMSMEAFTKVVSENSEIFANMGGNVQRGIDQFVNAQGALMGPGSKYSDAILGLGVSADEASKYLVSIMRGQGARTAAGMADADKLARYTAQYIIELDTLSKVTGLRRDQIDAEVKKAEEEEAWKIFMDSLIPDEAAKLKTMLAIARTYNGQGAVDQLKASVRGLDAPLTQSAERLAVATGGVSLQGDKLRNILFNSSIDVTQAGKMFTNSQIGMAVQAQNFQKSMGSIGMAAGVGADFLTREQNETARKLMAAGGSVDKMIELAKQQQAEQEKGDAARLARMNQSITNLGNQLGLAILPLIIEITNKLLPVIQKMMFAFMDFIDWLLNDPELHRVIKSVINWFAGAFAELQGAWQEGGFALALRRLIEVAIEGIHELWTVIGPPIKEGFHAIWKEVKPALLEMWESLMKALEPIFVSMLKSVGKALGLTVFETEDDVQRRKLQDALNQQQATAGERLKSLPSFAIEGIAKTIPGLGWLGKQAEASRIESDSKYLQEQGRFKKAMTRSEMAKAAGASNTEDAKTESIEEKIRRTAAEDPNNPDNKNPSSDKLSEHLDRLNNTNAQMLHHMKEMTKHAKDNVSATKALNGNLLPQ